MPTYERCPKTVEHMADALLKQYHEDNVKAEVKFDFMFAIPTLDEHGEPVGEAIMHHGRKALGLARIVSLKDRAKGMGDAEILIDKYWWETAPDEQQKALLDHELHHITLKIDKRGLVVDDLGRPKLVMRKHDVEVGFFRVIAERHGKASQEQIQAATMMDGYGQYFWPDMVKQLKAA